MSAQQNLVPNGSFESHNACPYSLSQPTDQQLIYCNNWFIPTLATSDYYNICASSTSGVSIPLNSLGYQIPFDGNAYAGILVYDSLSGINYKEYLSVKLTNKLVAQSKYNLTFYVSLSNNSTHAVKDIGGIFTQNQITQNNFNSIITTPNTNNNVYYTDTLNWIKIVNEYTAIGNEEYVNIGKFNDTTSSDILYLYNPDGLFPYSYYYIDGIILQEVQENCTQIIPTVFTPNADNINDLLSFNFCDKILKTTIYNRWGIKVFDTENVNHYWDGTTTSGEPCTAGTYFYIIQTENEIFKGFIELIR